MPPFVLLVLPFMVAVGAHRFIGGLRTGVLTGPRLGARWADQPIQFVTSMILLGGATLAAAWMFLSGLAHTHVAISVAH